MSYNATVQQHARIAILRLLADQSNYALNDSLARELLADFGITYTRDQVKAEFAWLQEQGLVTVDELRGLFVARITERGEDVSAGRTEHPGVKRPGP